jgi:tetratricopeptide (TPR) repeat protein
VSIRDELLGSSPQVDDLWARFHRIERICFFKPLLRDAPEEMKQALRKSADRILATYTEESPTTRADDWERARKYLTAAVAIDDQDTENRARLLYSQAQLSLIEGIRSKKTAERRDLWDKAVAGFQRSLELDEWPDPHIALASFYDYKRFDFSRLERHVRRAWALGHPRDKRTRAILADGHLSQSRRFLKDSRDRRMSASRKVSLEEGLRHAKEAIALYQEGLLDFSPDTPANNQEAMALRDEARRGLKRFKA